MIMDNSKFNPQKRCKDCCFFMDDELGETYCCLEPIYVHKKPYAYPCKSFATDDERF